MNKLLFITVIALIVSFTVIRLPALAETTATTSVQDLIQSLEKQIEKLRAQIEALRQSQSQVTKTTQDVSETLKLIGQLREGMSGEQVKLLQTILTSDSSIYPEGLITGYYGKLTVKAVKNFQKKHNLENIGQVGPKTLKILNKLLDENPVIKEKDENGQESNCAIVPPGHLIAPGWLRKQNGVRPIVPTCQVLPPGIAKKLGISTATSTPVTDTTAPVISNVTAANIASTSAHVTWTTNELSDSKVWYSTSSPVSATTTTPMVSSTILVTSHDLLLTSLTASTTYYFSVSSADASKNTATSSESSFKTLAP